MMDRGREEGHFYFCNQREAEVILGAPHYFCASTVSWKDTEKRKIRHVSNPSSISKECSRSLNMLQRIPSNVGNNPLWPLQNFVLFYYGYSSDISSAFRRIKVTPEHQRFQLVIGQPLPNFSLLPYRSIWQGNH